MLEEPIASTMEMEALDCSEILVNFYQTTWRQAPEDSSLQKVLNFQEMQLHGLCQLFQ